MTLNEFKIKAADEYKKEKVEKIKKRERIFSIFMAIVFIPELVIIITALKDTNRSINILTILPIVVYAFFMIIFENQKRKPALSPEEISVHEAVCMGTQDKSDDDSSLYLVDLQKVGDTRKYSVPVSKSEYNSYRPGDQLVCAEMGKHVFSELIIWPRNQIDLDSFDEL